MHECLSRIFSLIFKYRLTLCMFNLIYLDITHSASSFLVNTSSLTITLLVSDCHFACSCIFLSSWSIFSASVLSIALLRLALRKQLNWHWKETEISEYSWVWYRSQAYSCNSERLWDVSHVSAVVCKKIVWNRNRHWFLQLLAKWFQHFLKII